MVSRSTTTTEDKRCHLLELPAELRNTIYRYSFCREGKIYISSPAATQQPALLRICRAIREQASSIFYLEDEISAGAHNFDPSMWLAFWRHAGWHLPKNQAHTIQTDIGRSTNSSSHLRKWVKAFWEGKTTYMNASPSASPQWNVVEGAFSTARKVKLLGAAWEEAEEMLKDYKIATDGFME